MNLENYINTLHRVYDNGTNNHLQHNDNPLYWDLLLKDLKINKKLFEGKKALDFGCGKGRNVTNMLSLANFKQVDGVDISKNNIEYCKEKYSNQNSDFYLNNGKDLKDLKTDEYFYVMSTIVFQHICVHELRYNLKKEIYRVMKKGGIFSFQMGYGDLKWKGNNNVYSYYSNNYNVKSSNSDDDVRVEDINFLIKDLKEIGFINISYSIEKTFNNGGHPNWVYINCKK